MPKARHVSDGHLAIYGRREINEYDRMLDWRSATHNETKGMPERDNYGSNSAASLFWLPYSPDKVRYSARALQAPRPVAAARAVACPFAKPCPLWCTPCTPCGCTQPAGRSTDPRSLLVPAAALPSRVRALPLKSIQDIGTSRDRGASRSPTSSSELPPVPASHHHHHDHHHLHHNTSRPATALPVTRQRHRPTGFGLLEMESTRLHAASHSRAMAQTFLLAGNLTQAKLFLRRAEGILTGGLAEPDEE